jgi:hypothetical protein
LLVRTTVHLFRNAFGKDAVYSMWVLYVLGILYLFIVCRRPLVQIPPAGAAARSRYLIAVRDPGERLEYYLGAGNLTNRRLGVSTIKLPLES